MHVQNAETFAFFKSCKAYETALEMKAEGKFGHFGISYGKPVIVMEPVKGGNLANFPDDAKAVPAALKEF